MPCELCWHWRKFGFRGWKLKVCTNCVPLTADYQLLKTPAALILGSAAEMSRPAFVLVIVVVCHCCGRRPPPTPTRRATSTLIQRPCSALFTWVWNTRQWRWLYIWIAGCERRDEAEVSLSRRFRVMRSQVVLAEDAQLPASGQRPQEAVRDACGGGAQINAQVTPPGKSRA